MSIFDLLGKCDTRPVKCKVCGKDMYYCGEEGNTPEYEIKIHQDSKQVDYFYVHESCWNKVWK